MHKKPIPLHPLSHNNTTAHTRGVWYAIRRLYTTLAGVAAVGPIQHSNPKTLCYLHTCPASLPLHALRSEKNAYDRCHAKVQPVCTVFGMQHTLLVVLHVVLFHHGVAVLLEMLYGTRWG